jgi:Icc-related predicted phosphoesterase
MISTGYGNETPWKCPRDIKENELAEKIDGMASRIRNRASAVFNLHVPPYGSGLDRCPKLDVSVDPPRPVVGEQMAAGSHAVREAIEYYEPMISLHGHIHESPGIQRLGRTLSINAGSEYGEGLLRSAVIDVVDNGTKATGQLLTA